MSEWTRSNLAEIAELRFGKTPSRSEARFWNPSGGYPWATIADMRTDPVLETAETVSEAGLPFAGRSVSAGSTMMSFKLTVGRVARAGTDLLTNEAIVSIHGSEGKADDGWLYHALPGIARGGVTDTAVKGSTLNKAKLEKLKVHLPPLEEQRRIAEILDTIDETIQATERLIVKLENISIALREASFSQGRIDEFVRLGDACQILGGKRLPSGHSYAATSTPYRYLRVVDFYKRDVDYESLLALSESTFEVLDRYEVRSGELFISIAGSIGHVGVNDPPIGMRTVLTENAARIVPLRSFIPDFLALQMNLPQVVDQVKAEIGTGGGVPKLALHRVANIRVCCPDISIQNEIVHRHRAEHAARDSEMRRLDKLRELRAGLAADLLSGRMRTVAT